MSAPQRSESVLSGALTVKLIGERTLRLAAELGADERILAIAGGQSRCASRAQLRAGGVERHLVDRRVRARWLVEVLPGVLAVAPFTADDPRARLTAALLSCGTGAVLSHRSAAATARLRRPEPVGSAVHVTVPEGRHHLVRNGVVVHRSAILTRVDLRIVDGLPCTSAARTLLDEASDPDTKDRELERMYDEAVFVRRLATRPSIIELLRRCGRHRGRRRLGALLAGKAGRGSTQTESDPEEEFLALVRAAGIEEPEQQVEILGRRIDFLWRVAKVAVEIDAYGTHGSPARFETDRRKDSELLVRTGIVTLRFTRARIRREQLSVLAQLVAAVESRRRPPS